MACVPLKKESRLRHTESGVYAWATRAASRVSSHGGERTRLGVVQATCAGGTYSIDLARA